MSCCFCCKPINFGPLKFGISRGKEELMTKRKVGVGSGRVRASKLESFGSPNFSERMERAWLISQQPRPVACSSCNSEGHVECKWCSGTGFFIIGDNMLCQVPSRNTTCVICSGKGSACCSDCKGTGYRAKWLGEPPVSKMVYHASDCVAGINAQVPEVLAHSSPASLPTFSLTYEKTNLFFPNHAPDSKKRSMAVLQLQPFLSDTLPKITTFSHLNPVHKKLGKRKIILCAHPSQNPSYQHEKIKRRGQKLNAVAKEVGVNMQDGGDQSVIFVASNQEEVIEQRDVVSYDWTEEWYPLYLSKNVPDDAPLGLTVYDKQVVLYRDGTGDLRCFEDRCPHRLAKLSEGQLFDGRLECLYHGWQFEGSGKCVKIPQLTSGAKIPQSACLKPYEIKESQGVVWIWMSHKTPPNFKKIPWFENFDRPGFRDMSTIHELPYDHSILLENLMDPAHVPISHDRTDFTAKREDATSLFFEVTERTDRGFAGWWGREIDRSTPNYIPNFLRFEAPCVLQNNREIIDKNGEKHYFSGLFLCRPSGQGKSMLIVRFGNTRKPPMLLRLFPQWYLHQNAGKVFEQDMGFLSSQNEILMKEKVPTKELYISLRSSDTWVAEYRKWMDKVGHGMPYYFGHSTISLPEYPAVIEHAPAGLVANLSASQPAKGGIGTMHAPNLANRYFRHVIHCKECMNTVKAFRTWKSIFSTAALISTALAILISGRQWKAVLLFSTSLCLVGIHLCSTAITMNTTNFIRTHRRF